MSTDTYRFSTVEAADMTGLTYRQSDYWCRNGIFDHMNGGGTGSRRMWSVEDVSLLYIVARLRALGAEAQQLARVAEMLRMLPVEDWTVCMWVDRDGVATFSDSMPAGTHAAWVVDLDACLAELW